MTKLITASETIDRLGGTTAFATWWGTSKGVVSHWRRNGFPASTYIQMSERLRAEHGIAVSPSAWTFQRAPSKGAA